MKQTTIAAVILTCGLLLKMDTATAQAEWQNRNSIAIRASATEKLDLQLNHMWAYDMSNKFQSIFRQTGVQATYELSKRADVSGGMQFLTSSGSTETRTRIFVRGAYTIRVGKELNWTNAIRLETNSKVETRFRNRIGISTRVALRKRMDFLNLTPSISGIIFYNIGGNPIRYYDKDAQLIARQTPDGFHRGRITFNLNSRVNKYLQVNLFYMRQQEFNFLTSDTRKMNVYDPVRNRTLRPFNNFNSIGLSARINLDPLIHN
jgi:Protein of unknown function (DUF2490)